MSHSTLRIEQPSSPLVSPGSNERLHREKKTKSIASLHSPHHQMPCTHVVRLCHILVALHNCIGISSVVLLLPLFLYINDKCCFCFLRNNFDQISKKYIEIMNYCTNKLNIIYLKKKRSHHIYRES